MISAIDGDSVMCVNGSKIGKSDVEYEFSCSFVSPRSRRIKHILALGSLSCSVCSQCSGNG
jgi:hypothetical protein